MEEQNTRARRLDALRKTVGLASAQRRVGRVSRTLLGRPLATSEEPQQQVSKAQALPILASDNVSSSAYATEELARVLVLAGAAALSLTMPLAIGLVAVLAVVVVSYSQVIRAYPSGGGSYAASKENLGSLAGLVAASSLLVDYVLTVAVSVSAGVAAITSAAPELFDYRVPISLLIIAALVVGNLRGVREASTVFSIPTYVYILMLASLIIYGLVRLFTGTMPEYQAPAEWAPAEVQALTFILVLRAFSSGAVALTGVEAVSNGVPMLRPPQARNANITLAWMAIIFGTLFLGISFLSAKVGLIPDPAEQKTLVSQLAVLVAGDGWYHLIIQAATALILILAANTAFVGFPRLGSVLAADRWFPNQFLFRGRRLALATGIVGVGVVAALLVVMFRASVASLIPLYTVGVFVAFTLSQAGMVRYWQRTKGRWWRTAMVLNGVGAVVTGIVAVEAITVKFSHGAWMVLVVIPLLVLAMMAIRRHYLQLARQLALESPLPPLATVTHTHTVVVPVADINKAVLAALAYARSLSPRVQAVHVTDDLEGTAKLRQRWDEWAKDIPLFILEAPYRDWTGPLLRYVEALSQEDQSGPVTVVVPEFVPSRWWEFLLHSQSAFRLKMALLSRPNVVVVDIPYHLRS
ncbi:MAG TPA: APC family permease [Dehalococcoidia bacterium]|nr:APC family permease [Dehalococcoidia bacterium]